MSTEIDLALKLGVALLFSAIIGAEREMRGRPAGLHTHVMVGVGAALFTLVGIEIAPSSPAVIASGVVTGVGFLGAGMIFKDKFTTYGLTSAAAIWTTAAIGLACGAGYFLEALIATAIVMAVPLVPHKHNYNGFEGDVCHTCGRKLPKKRELA